MKTIRTLLILVFLIFTAGTRAQLAANFGLNPDKRGNSIVLDESFSVSQDTLFFLDAQAFTDGRQFYILNPHDYAINIQYIQQSGIPYPPLTYLLWYTIPNYSTFPVTILPHDSIPLEVRWVVTDAMPKSTTVIYDTLSITSLTDAHNVIIAADSIYITISTTDKHLLNFFTGPNPFKDQIKISWNVSQGESVDLTVYNALMQPIRMIFSGRASGQKQECIWDGLNENHQRISPGVYFIKLQTSTGKNIIRVIAL